jgi:hypothetical protein
VLRGLRAGQVCSPAELAELEVAAVGPGTGGLAEILDIDLVRERISVRYVGRGTG